MQLDLTHPATSAFDRWLSDKTVAVGECQRWTRHRTVDGLPVVHRRGRVVAATTLVWEHHHGPLPEACFVGPAVRSTAALTREAESSRRSSVRFLLAWRSRGREARPAPGLRRPSQVGTR